MPRFTPVRPDFMAPGPSIKIEKKEGLLLEQASTQNKEANDDEDFSPYRYYKSDKILGTLYRAIDEHEIFSELHSHRLPPGSKTLLDQLWTYVSRACQMIPWHQHIPEARVIMDTYVHFLEPKNQADTAQDMKIAFSGSCNLTATTPCDQSQRSKLSLATFLEHRAFNHVSNETYQ